MKPPEDNILSLSGTAMAELMQAVLERGCPFRFTAHGWSMSPFIRDGDILTIAPLGQQPLPLGEVVAFVHPVNGKLVIHRAVAYNGSVMLIQGDANGCKPEPIPLRNVLGRVVRVERSGRQVRLGLGAERWLIAWLNRNGLLWRFVLPLWWWLAPLRQAILRISTRAFTFLKNGSG